MASDLPLRLVTLISGKLYTFNPLDPYFYPQVLERGFDIISYTWSDPRPAYQCGIEGVTWDLTIDQSKLRDIQRLLECGEAGDVLPFMWVDCLCINQVDKSEKSNEIAKMYHYYRNARKCHILLDMETPWDPQKIIDDLQLVGHVITHMRGSAVTSESKLTDFVTSSLVSWAEDAPWKFPLPKTTVRSAGIDPGLLNCYSTSTINVRSLFDKFYFTRVWTFEEMLLGKNITMWGVGKAKIASIGAFETWIDLATESADKAVRLVEWIRGSRVLIPVVLDTILGRIEDDIFHLQALQIQVSGISCARTDVISGGPGWWYDNHKGISNVFSAVSLTPRSCYNREDIFRGLLGLFHGLFSPEEIKMVMAGGDMEKISFAFFKQLSIKTEHAWTRLAISSGEREGWDWIPVLANNPTAKLLTSDVFAGVVNLGHLHRKEEGLAKSKAITGLDGTPREYMTIKLKKQDNRGFRFYFKGCNCGKKIKTGFLKSEPIPTYDRAVEVARDETGRTLVHCAMVMGGVLDPGGDLVAYREQLLKKLQLDWRTSDPNAKPARWWNRCVSGTTWDNPGLQLRTHNLSMHYRMQDITECGSRLENPSTEDILAEVRVNCGCVLVGPFSWIFEALTSISGSSLGKTTAIQSKDDRIELRDGLGLVQVGDLGKAFKVVAFDGDYEANQSFSQVCRKTTIDENVIPKTPFPKGRALIPESYKHSMLRDYGYVPIPGAGNLLIFRGNPLGDYKVIGVCIDDTIISKKSLGSVTIK
ncbi:hypothetical protein ABW20_dc0100284 [Dactylellina cionopaga]|nr:hypothetical protein ABW20_dc0100284 [Dactylellina cionopaga]